MVGKSKEIQKPILPRSLESTTRELNNVRHALDKAAIVAITDRAGNIIHVNEKFCQISKYSPEELLGQNHRIINSGYHSREFFVEMWKTISSGKVWEGEIRNRAKDGSIYWVNTTIVPFLDEKGEPDQYVAIRYEITQRKNAEGQLRVYADRLESSNRELQDFASIAAHDLQEPLRKVLAFGDRLNTRFASVLGEDGRDYLERMLSSSRRMRKLIDDLLTYSRVATQARPFETTNLNEILNDVLSDLELRIEQAHGKIEKEILPTIDADPSQMRQLFQNLIANALKFHRKDVAPIVQITVKNTRDHCILSIVDNGIGFDEKYLDKIFTIFQRLHGKQEYEGTGVGLAVCRRIAERHGGAITAESSLGGGARFVVSLPLKH
jgi:two-component system sensor kinase FixL